MGEGKCLSAEAIVVAEVLFGFKLQSDWPQVELFQGDVIIFEYVCWLPFFMKNSLKDTVL